MTSHACSNVALTSTSGRISGFVTTAPDDAGICVSKDPTLRSVLAAPKGATVFHNSWRISIEYEIFCAWNIPEYSKLLIRFVKARCVSDRIQVIDEPALQSGTIGRSTMPGEQGILGGGKGEENGGLGQSGCRRRC